MLKDLGTFSEQEEFFLNPYPCLASHPWPWFQGLWHLMEGL